MKNLMKKIQQINISLEASKFPMTYYGQLSFNKINPGGNFELKRPKFFDKDYEKEFKKNKLN